MIDLARLGEFSEAEQARFKRIARLLLGGNCFSRARANSEDDWRFLIRQQGIFTAFFEVLGWAFELRQDLGAAVVRPSHRKHAHWLSVAQTHLVYHLIQTHFDIMTATDLDRSEVTINYGDLIERIRQTVPRGTRINNEALQSACKKLHNFGAIELARGFGGHPADTITVLPVIEMVVPREVIERQIKAAHTDEPTSDGAAESDDISHDEAQEVGDNSEREHEVLDV
jgi:hypothetical protein